MVQSRRRIRRLRLGRPHHGIAATAAAKWKRRSSVADLPTRPKRQASPVPTIDDRSVIVALRKPTLLRPDDSLYASHPV